MDNLSLHCYCKQHEPIEDKNRPKHRHIKGAEEGQYESYAKSFCNGIPALENAITTLEKNTKDWFGRQSNLLWLFCSLRQEPAAVLVDI